MQLQITLLILLRQTKQQQVSKKFNKLIHLRLMTLKLTQPAVIVTMQLIKLALHQIILNLKQIKQLILLQPIKVTAQVKN